jgi:PKD repeat protein
MFASTVTIFICFMKKIILFFVFFAFMSNIKSQTNHDAKLNYTWISGYGNEATGTIYHTKFSFQGDTLTIKSEVVENSLFMSYTNSSICDTSGNLLFFSNGCGVMDSNYQYISGASHINNGETQNYLCEEVGGGRYTNSLLILQNINRNVYDIIHSRINNNASVGPCSDKLFWSRIQQDSFGIKAVFVDSVLLDTFIYPGCYSSCRHANGQDWWVVVPQYSNETIGMSSNGYYMIRFSGNKTEIHSEFIGIPTTRFENSTGESAFNPQGTKYARYCIQSDLQVFDFDRCEGSFSNPIHVPILDAADTSYAAGVAFSPSGRFLYVSSTQYIYQFDMEAADFAGSKKTVAVYDGFYLDIPVFTTRFYQCELAPDGKIYVSCPGGKNTIHVIENPDSLGLACNVVQHKYILEWPISGGLPHFPNFRLGATADSCIHAPLLDVLVAGFTWSFPDITQQLKVLFKDVSGFEPTSWHWTFGDGGSSTAQNPTHTYAASSVYQVCLVVENLSGSDTLCQLVTVVAVGVEEVGVLNGAIKLFPNPANTTVTILGGQDGQSFRLYNSVGSLVFAGKIDSTKVFSIEKLPEGIYFFKLDDTKVVTKLIITH